MVRKIGGGGGGANLWNVRLVVAFAITFQI